MGPDSCSEQQAMYVNLNDIPVGWTLSRGTGSRTN
jgi:hypothetical protein